MKYLQKFNESVLTPEDEENIENLFLDWVDHKRCSIHSPYELSGKRSSFVVQIDLLHANGPLNREETKYSDGTAMPYAITYTGVEWCHMPNFWDVVDKDYWLRNDNWEKKYFITNKNSISGLFSMPYIHQLLFRYLDTHYDIQNQLLDILTKTKLLNYYGLELKKSAYTRMQGQDGFFVRLEVSRTPIYDHTQLETSGIVVVCFVEIEIVKKESI